VIYTTNTRASDSSNKKATAASLGGCNHFLILSRSLGRKETFFRFLSLCFFVCLFVLREKSKLPGCVKSSFRYYYNDFLSLFMLTQVLLVLTIDLLDRFGSVFAR